MSDEEKISSFKDLRVWQESRKLVLLIYKLTRSFSKDEQYGLTSQMRRAAVSILANIAEGFTRQTVAEKLQFYSISHGSLTELESHVLISRDLDFIFDESLVLLETQLTTVHKLINAFIKSAKINQIAAQKYQIPNTKY